MGGFKFVELWREIGVVVVDCGFVGILIDYWIFSDDLEISLFYGIFRDLILENSDVFDFIIEQF